MLFINSSVVIRTSSCLAKLRRRLIIFVRYLTMSSRTLEYLNFDNLALRSLPIDSIPENYVRKVSGACFSRVKPTPVKNPEVIAYSTSAMQELLDLPQTELDRSDFGEYFSGNKILPGSDTAAHCYCGHQFGYFAGQLGDGATMYIGEIVNSKGERWEIQFKGAGPTPYSRQADGRKVLRSSLREFLCSEAMHFLGIPTTRAGTCVTSESRVIRDIFYDGHPIEEKCTIILRIAPTFLRFGSFEIFKTLDPLTGSAGPSVGHMDIQKQLLDYTLSTFYPEIIEKHPEKNQERNAAFFIEIVKRTAKLVADWQCFGFCHGVLNTDNMSIVGVTIDYGPFGFMDRFHRDHICNASDDGGRYSYINQPKMCAWNLRKLAEALQNVLPLDISLQILDDTFSKEYNLHYISKMRRKLGLIRKQLPEDGELIEDFLTTMHETGADFSNSFRGLNQLQLPSCKNFDTSFENLKLFLVNQCCSISEYKESFKPTMSDSHFKVFLSLLSQNPNILEQLGKGERAIQREIERRNQYEKIKDMTSEDKNKSDEKSWDIWLQKYVGRLKHEAEPLEGETDVDVEDLNAQRVKIMNLTNPKIVLRNYIAQIAIEEAEKGNYEEVKKLLHALQDPYSETTKLEECFESKVNIQSTLDDAAKSSRATFSETVKSCYSRPPEWAYNLRVT